MNYVFQIEQLKNVNLNLLVILRVLLQTANVSQTAAILGVSQSSVSKALKVLRDTLGDPLLIRTSNTMYRTERAKHLAIQLERVFAGIEQVFQGADAFDPARVRRNITIGTNEYLQATMGTALINELAVIAPGLNLTFRPIAASVPSRLADGALDIVLGTDTLESRGLRSQVLYRERFICVAHCDAAPVLAPVTLERFCGLPQIDVSPSGNDLLTKIIEHQLLSGGERRNVVATVSSYYLIPMIARTLDAVALVPSRFCGLPGFMDALRVVPLGFEALRFNVGMYWHNVTHHDPLLAWVRERVVAMHRAQA